MAISILTQPQTFQPVYNPMYYRVTSTNVTQDNFNFVFDIYTGTTATTLVTRILLPPRPDASCIFSPARILEGLLTYDLIPSITAGTANQNCLKQYYIYFGESYGNLITGVTTYSNLNFDSGYTWNAVLNYEQVPSFIYTAYTLSNSTKKFLSDSPATNYFSSAQDRATLSYLNATSAQTGDVSTKIGRAIQVTTYQTSGGNVSNFIYVPIATADTTSSKMIHIPSGVWNLNNVPASLFTYGVGTPGAVVNVATDYKYEVTVWAADSPTAIDIPISETKTYRPAPCTKYQPVNLCWLNSLGGFDYFTFTCINRLTMNLSRTQYKQDLPFNYTVGTRGYTTLDIDARESRLVTSDWVNDQQSNAFKSLLKSIQQYEVQSDGSLLPILIDNNSVEIKKSIVDMLYNYEFSYTYAYKVGTQRS